MFVSDLRLCLGRSSGCYFLSAPLGASQARLGQVSPRSGGSVIIFLLLYARDSVLVVANLSRSYNPGPDRWIIVVAFLKANLDLFLVLTVRALGWVIF